MGSPTRRAHTSWRHSALRAPPKQSPCYPGCSPSLLHPAQAEPQPFAALASQTLSHALLTAIHRSSLVLGRWYLSTSDDSQRRSYELLPGKVYVPVSTLVQEPGLEFTRAGMHERILSDASHVAIMSWNFSNVQGFQK